jgi:hypothetical protein
MRTLGTGGSSCCLTFDMGGGHGQAKLAGGRPLDGGLRRHAGPRPETALEGSDHSNHQGAKKAKARALADMARNRALLV